MQKMENDFRIGATCAGVALDDNQRTRSFKTGKIARKILHSSTSDKLGGVMSKRDGPSNRNAASKAAKEDKNDDQSEDESSDDSPVEVIEPIALYRSRRANAGKNMAALLSEQEGRMVVAASGEDDVYATAYGGFGEDENDERVQFLLHFECRAS